MHTRTVETVTTVPPCTGALLGCTSSSCASRCRSNRTASELKLSPSLEICTVSGPAAPGPTKHDTASLESHCAWPSDMPPSLQEALIELAKPDPCTVTTVPPPLAQPSLGSIQVTVGTSTKLNAAPPSTRDTLSPTSSSTRTVPEL